MYSNRFCDDIVKFCLSSKNLQMQITVSWQFELTFQEINTNFLEHWFKALIQTWKKNVTYRIQQRNSKLRILPLKVSKSRKQFMVSSILPKNERNSLSWASFLLRISTSWVSFFFWKNWGHHNLLSRLSEL